MTTEYTDNKQIQGWVLYDAGCGFCTAWAKRFQAPLARRRWELLPLQTPWVRTKLGLADAELLAEMRVLNPDGEVFGGADALLEISRHFWWAWPIRQLSHVPGMLRLFRAGYRWVARQRNCACGTCGLGNPIMAKRNHPFFDFVPLLVLPWMVLLFRARVESWVFMWAMACSLYAGCKWLTYRVASRRGAKCGVLRTMGYLLAWPGMDAADFLNPKQVPNKPLKVEWLFGLAKIFIGAALLWGMARMALPGQPILAGWLGMIGAVFMLHFGSFHLLSLAWRHAGVPASPIMQNPLLAKSLAEFWGDRWNTAFNELAFRFTFRPLRRWTTPGVATMAVFALSGFIHELVISLPARGGYGGPTGYFLVQGLGAIAERSRLGKNLGLGRGVRGWIFMLLVTASPLFWLFHPPFITNVILPMLTAIGAT